MPWIILCRILGAGALLGFFAAAFTPLPTLLALQITRPPQLEPAEAIVVLGAGIRPDGTLSDPSLRRAVEGIALQRQGLAPLLVLAGPERRQAPGLTEAGVRAGLAQDLGVPPELIATEVTARTTREEAARIGALLQAQGVRRILLVTGALHMPRARGVFERAGLEVLEAPVQQRSVDAATPESRLELLGGILGELLARLYYRAAGHL